MDITALLTVVTGLIAAIAGLLYKQSKSSVEDRDSRTSAFVSQIDALIKAGEEYKNAYKQLADEERSRRIEAEAKVRELQNEIRALKDSTH